MPTDIRPLALGLVRRGADLLVFRGEDDGAEFFRLLGGGVEFGETAEQALRREFVEEIDVKLGELRLLGVLENRFTYRGAPGHEIVFVFAADWPARAVLPLVIADTGEPVSWQPVSAFRTGAHRLYPEGLLAWLEG